MPCTSRHCFNFFGKESIKELFVAKLRLFHIKNKICVQETFAISAPGISRNIIALTHMKYLISFVNICGRQGCVFSGLPSSIYLATALTQFNEILNASAVLLLLKLCDCRTTCD